MGFFGNPTLFDDALKCRDAKVSIVFHVRFGIPSMA
jgi:hypothetical protein